MKVKITYCSNYNSVDVVVDGKAIDWNADPKLDAMTEEMCDWANQFCNEEEGGLWEGDDDALVMEFTTIAKKHLGDNVEVEVDFDNFSS